MDISAFQPEEGIKGETPADTKLLREMAVAARRYLHSFRWCPGTKELRLADGVAGLVAIFHIELAKDVQGEKALWVIVGDLPSVYMNIVPDDNARDALERYCLLMEDWADAVLEKRLTADQYPVEAEASPENATSLLGRIAFIRSEVLNTEP